MGKSRVRTVGEPMLVSDDNLSRAWARVLLGILDGAGTEVSPLVLSLTGFNDHGMVSEDLNVRQSLDSLPLEAYRSFSELFGEDVLSISADTSTRARDVPGGTAPGRVRAALSKARALLERPDA